MSLFGKRFARNPGLGKYTGTRRDWVCAYRAARSRKRVYPDANPSRGGLFWKAQLIVYFHRETPPYSGDPHMLKILRDVNFD
jgi:hypothetical protein